MRAFVENYIKEFIKIDEFLVTGLIELYKNLMSLGFGASKT